MKIRRAALLTMLAGTTLFLASSDLYAQFKIMHNYGLERGDYKDFDLSRPAWEDCRDACAADANCLSFTYTIPIPGPNGRAAHCWLKNIVPRGEGRDWCISGVKGCNVGSYRVEAPARVSTGSRFKVQISTASAGTAGHWVGIFDAGTRHHQGRWAWVRDLSTCEWEATAPGPGNYEIRYVLAGDDWPVAARHSLTVQ
jgi:hypothetical protein